MTCTIRPRRLVLLAVSTAIATGGVPVPATAFAAPAAPHSAVADSDRDWLRTDRFGQWGQDEREQREEDGYGKWDHGEPDEFNYHPGKGGPFEGQQWQCFSAPCGPPEWYR